MFSEISVCAWLAPLSEGYSEAVRHDRRGEEQICSPPVARKQRRGQEKARNKNTHVTCFLQLGSASPVAPSDGDMTLLGTFSIQDMTISGEEWGSPDFMLGDSSIGSCPQHFGYSLTSGKKFSYPFVYTFSLTACFC